MATTMTEKTNKMTNRSYTLGRILAIYQTIEEIYPKISEQNIPTTFEKVCSRYINEPLSFLTELETWKKKADEVCIKSENFNKELYENYSARLSDLLKDIDMTDDSPLDYNFIFGFTKEKTNLVMEEFPNFKEMRNQLGWSQRKAAEKLGVPLRTWEGWERKLRNPPKYVEQLLLEKMALFLIKKEV